MSIGPCRVEGMTRLTRGAIPLTKSTMRRVLTRRPKAAKAKPRGKTRARATKIDMALGSPEAGRNQASATKLTASPATISSRTHWRCLVRIDRKASIDSGERVIDSISVGRFRLPRRWPLDRRKFDHRTGPERSPIPCALLQDLRVDHGLRVHGSDCGCGEDGLGALVQQVPVVGHPGGQELPRVHEALGRV